jgi:tetratricopeptide (TPR) repeat protein
MSLINEALKKAGQEVDQNDPLEHAYPEKIYFVSRHRSSIRLPMLLWLGGAVVIGLLLVLSLQMPAIRQPLFRLVGLGGPAKMAAMPKAAPAPLPAVVPPVIDRTAVEKQIDVGVSAYTARNFTAARSAFVSALQLDASSATAHNGLGLIEKSLGNPAEAERHYLQAIRFAPNQPEAHNNLALVYDQRGETDRAIVEYTTALTLRPDYPEARLNYAMVLERAGRVVDAKKEYQKFLAHVPPGLAAIAGTVKVHLTTLS